MSKFRRSGSAESSSSSSAHSASTEYRVPSTEPEPEDEDSVLGTRYSELERSDGTPVSPLAMMNENSPEAWLGQFLIALDMSTPRGTVEGARRDPALLAGLTEVRASMSGDNPLALLDPDQAAALRARDWAAWWRAQDELGRFCWATLALSLLGYAEYVDDLTVMYRQTANSRIRKEAHVVLCHMLGKPWPAHGVTDADIERLRAGS